MKLMSETDKEFFKKLLVKTISMFGFTYFTACMATQTFIQVIPSLITSGLYLFTELARYYKLHPEKKDLNNSYNFLI